MGVFRSICHVISFGIVDSNEEHKRKNTPCVFADELTKEDFRRIAIQVAKPIKRLVVEVRREFVIGQVRTTSGINTWRFILDFNDYGKISGRYWFRAKGNSDSQIPEKYAKELRHAIQEHLETVRFSLL